MKGLLTRLKALTGSSQAPAPAPAAPGRAEGGGVLVNAYCTRADVPALDFPHTLHSRRDLSDPELAPHLSGFVGYVLSRGNGEMSRNRYHAMRHIQRVQQHLSLSVDESQLDAFSAWAGRANAIVFLPDGDIRDPDGRVLLSASGQEPDPEAAVPYPEEAWQRKARTEALRTPGSNKASSPMYSLGPIAAMMRSPRNTSNWPSRTISSAITRTRWTGMPHRPSRATAASPRSAPPCNSPIRMASR